MSPRMFAGSNYRRVHEVDNGILRPANRMCCSCCCNGRRCLAAILWRMEPTASQLTFVGNRPALNSLVVRALYGRHPFDPADLANSKFIIDIDMTTVNTKDKERDDILKGSDLFDAKRWPKARYVAETFTAKDAIIFRHRQLTIRDVTAMSDRIRFHARPCG